MLRFNPLSGTLDIPSDSTALNAHTSNTSNPHNVTKAQVGLGNVDNTSDADKPVSTAQAASIALKANASDTVNLTGNQTVAGVKTFSSSPIVPTATTNTQAVNKDQMDTADALKVNKAGDTMTGALNTRDVRGSAASTYNLGQTSNRYFNVFVDRVRLGSTELTMLSGTGFPEGVVTASVGSIYIDTAITNGASSWIKKSGTGSTGWSVSVGDTGWRNLGQLWPQITENILLRRIGDVCYVTSQGEVLTIVSTVINTSRLMQLGFKPSGRTELLITNNGSVVGRILAKQAEQSLFLTTNIIGAYNAIANSSYLTTDAWPTTLPGTPA